ncbi:hypothetical protein BGZ97_007857, partial [Linnemannia gamsii]
MAIIDHNFASVYERWAVQKHEDGITIQNEGIRYWLITHGKDVVGSSEFEKAGSSWDIEQA